MGIRVLIPAFMLASGSVFAQATPPALPTEKPATFDGKMNPKEDKSRLRDLSGAVKDEAGAPIENAVVQLKNGRTGKVIDFITKKDGGYTFTALNMDIDYELTAKRDGFGDPVKKTLSKYDSRRPATLNFELVKKESGKAERPSKD
jgi:hypothetical protein